MWKRVKVGSVEVFGGKKKREKYASMPRWALLLGWCYVLFWFLKLKFKIIQALTLFQLYTVTCWVFSMNFFCCCWITVYVRFSVVYLFITRILPFIEHINQVKLITNLLHWYICMSNRSHLAVSAFDLEWSQDDSRNLWSSLVDILYT